MTGPEVVLHASDPDGLSAAVAFGTPRFETRVDDGHSWTRVQLDPFGRFAGEGAVADP